MAKENISMSQHLTFKLGEEVFAVPINSTREVLEMTEVTKIPRTPPYMRGVINLRGHAVPVMDLRQKFGMRAKEDTVETCIIITEVSMGAEKCILGGLVDSVREVLDLDDASIEAPPSMGTAVAAEFIKGMTRVGDEFVIILQVDKMFSSEEIVQAGAVAQEATGVPVTGDLAASV
ncbi:MAG: chemotaxis protein CheW [Proteobacteria bacterium]|nr:chemotaxis protein CheW [Pseudomonadota bacterium]